ncbi:MAG: MlaD family protein [Nannocystaceae bacterium]
MKTKLVSLGLFVVLSLGLFAWLAFQLGALKGANWERYRVELHDASGLVPGNAIKSAGVEIGRVHSVTLIRDEHGAPRAELELEFRPGTTIMSDALVSVQPRSLLGEKFLDLRQGKDPAATALDPGAQLPTGERSVDFADLFNLARPVIYSEEELYPHLVELTKRLNQLLGTLDTDDSEKLRDELSSIGDKIGSVLDNTSRLTTLGREVVEENRDDLRSIVTNGEALLGNPKMRSVVERSDRILAILENRVPKISDRMERVLDKGERLLDAIDAKKLDKIVDDAAIVAANTAKITAELKPVAKASQSLVDNLAVLAKRGASLTEKTLRTFLQAEGVRIFLSKPSREIRGKIDGAATK